MKVLILYPDNRLLGGVASYYLKLKGKFTLPVEYYTIGKRLNEKGILSKIYRMVTDYCRFAIKLKKNQYEVVHVNPSLGRNSFLREGIFLLLARMYNKRTIVFIHGWEKPFERFIERNWLWVFKLLYGKTNAFIVLAEEFKNILELWRCTQPIYREVTVIEDDILQGFDILKAITERQESENWRILFLARIRKNKGIYETIEAVSILKTKYPQLELLIAGDGKELENVKSFVHLRNISNVSFAGFVKGEEKNKLLRSAHVLCFPTTHAEGFPNVIVESMAFGLPVVTRPVGGIADFFKNGEHGFITSSKKPGIFADFMEKLLLDKQLYRKISLNNYHYAQANFLASQAALRLEKIYESLLM